jgi:16S rRNA (guanine527-N7)-methyltransferase
MDTSRISTLLHPFLDRTLPEVQLQQISTYIDLLLRWNARINLTAIRDPDEIVTRHFGESLFLAGHLFREPSELSVARAPSPAWPKASTDPHQPDTQTLRSLPLDVVALGEGLLDKSVRPTLPAISVLDIGSGAGFPGLPLKIWAPTIFLTLVESNHKKATFLREVIRALTLTNINVNTARAETLTSIHPPADIVTLRAVEHFDTVVPIAASLVVPTGRLALLIGSSQLSDLAAHTPNLTWSAPIPVPKSDSRVLSIGVPL